MAASRFPRRGPASRTGRLRQRVTLHRPGAEVLDDAFGQPVEAGDAVGTYWAEVLPVRSSEGPGPAGERLEGEVTHLVTLRFGVEVLAGDRIEWRGLRLDAIGPGRDVEGRRRRVEVPCVEHHAAALSPEPDPDPEG